VKRRPPRSSAERGSILILTALSMTVLLGFAALALDVGYLYDSRSRMGAAADAAAKGAGLELLRNPSISNTALTTFAEREAAAMGFDTADGQTTVAVNSPPANGPFAARAGYVEVIINRPMPTFLMSVFGMNTVTVGSRAVSGPSPSPLCLVTLAPSPTDALGLDLAIVSAPGCTIVDNGNLTGFLAALSAGAIFVTGNQTCFCFLAPAPITGTPPLNDPLSYLTPPTLATCTQPGPGAYVFPGGALPAGKYCGGITIAGDTTLSGTYIITGSNGLKINPLVNVSGTDVLIYNHGTGPLAFTGSLTTLTAATTGNWAGILIYQDPGNPQPFDLSIGFYSLTGTLYFPNASVTFGGAIGWDNSVPYNFVVAKTFTIAFALVFDLNHDTSSLPGGSPLKTIAIAE
jgi:hypothetical protein